MISSYLSNESQLDDRTIHLLFSANRWEKRSLMESKLKSGTPQLLTSILTLGLLSHPPKDWTLNGVRLLKLGCWLQILLCTLTYHLRKLQRGVAMEGGDMSCSNFRIKLPNGIRSSAVLTGRSVIISVDLLTKYWFLSVCGRGCAAIVDSGTSLLACPT